MLDLNMFWWLLLVWFGGTALYDYLISRNIPLWMLLPPLVGGLVYVGQLAGAWVSVALGVALLGTELRRLRTPVVILPILLVSISLSLLQLSALTHLMVPLSVGWFLLYALWEFHAVGGADALAGMTLLLWFPSWAMFWAVLVGMLLWSSLTLFRKFGQDAAVRVFSVFKAGAPGTRAPGMVSFPLALLVFRLLVHAL